MKYHIGAIVGKFEILLIDKKSKAFQVICNNCGDIKWVSYNHFKRDSEKKCKKGSPNN